MVRGVRYCDNNLAAAAEPRKEELVPSRGGPAAGPERTGSRTKKRMKVQLTVGGGQLATWKALTVEVVV